jgi:hypothetical protein
MGFFSQDCDGCGHPLLSYHATNHINYWMEDVTVIKPNGEVVEGVYDGYGRVLGEYLDEDGDWVECTEDEAVGFDNTVWHTDCLKQSGKPALWTGPSRYSEDQGFFFERGAHNMTRPGVLT